MTGGRRPAGPATAGAARPRVVVVGGGFAGMSAVRELAGTATDVLLVDAEPFATFQPFLYQVATGGLNRGDITYSLRTFVSRFPNASFTQARVTGLDTATRRVHLDGAADIAYDAVIVCCGVVANYFGVAGAEDHARTIYSPRAATAVRDRILGSLEAAAQRGAGAEASVVVVGGGATGVEMAGALAEMRNATLPLAYPELSLDQVRLVLVEQAGELLGPFHPGLRAYAADALRRRGVELRLGTPVERVGPDHVVAGGERLPAAVTVWATGVEVDRAVGAWGLPQGRGGRIEVGPDLRVAGHPGVFAAGDVAAITGGPLPQLAQPAIQSGRHAARQALRALAGEEPEPFAYRDRGIMATVGRSDAVVQLAAGIELRGLVAWLGWLGLHVLTLMSNRNRLATLANLSVRYLTWRRSVNVIIGDAP